MSVFFVTQGGTHCRISKEPMTLGVPVHRGDPKQCHTCLEGQTGVAAVDATQGLAHELHDAADLGLDVSEADFGERIAVLVDKHST